MKNILIITSVLVCLSSAALAYMARQEAQILRHSNEGLKQSIDQRQGDLERLALLLDGSVDPLEEGYKKLDAQLRLFSQCHGSKVSLEVEGVGQDGKLSLGMGPSQWPGISQAFLDLRFYKLKELEEHLKTYRFLNLLRSQDQVEIVQVAQKNGQLEVRMKLYGRGA